MKKDITYFAEAVAPASGTRKIYLIKFLFDEDIELFSDDHAFAFMSTNDLIEQKNVTVLNFMLTNNLLSASFKETRLISIQIQIWLK